MKLEQCIVRLAPDPSLWLIDQGALRNWLAGHPNLLVRHPTRRWRQVEQVVAQEREISEERESNPVADPAWRELKRCLYALTDPSLADTSRTTRVVTLFPSKPGNGSSDK